MRKRAMVAAAAAAALVTVGLAAPAQAESVSAKCEVTEMTPGGEVRTWTLDGVARYAMTEDGYHHWYSVGGKFSANENAGLGNQNNLDFLLQVDEWRIWAHESGDNVPRDQWYSVNPDRITQPERDEKVRFPGIFDRPWEGDSECIAWSDPI